MRLDINYTAGPFGESAEPEPAAPAELALVCVTCGTEVCLVTADDLAAMESLPGHPCRKEDVA